MFYPYGATDIPAEYLAFVAPLHRETQIHGVTFFPETRDPGYLGRYGQENFGFSAVIGHFDDERIVILTFELAPKGGRVWHYAITRFSEWDPAFRFDTLAELLEHLKTNG